MSQTKQKDNPDALMEMFLTLDPQSFKDVAVQLSALFTKNKRGFNTLLEKFCELSKQKLEFNSTMDIRKKHYIKDDSLNNLLTYILWKYLSCEREYLGGYLRCMLPVKKEKEDDASFNERYRLRWDSFNDLMIQTLDDCEYFQR